MADPAPTERPMPVGYGFRPNNRELVGQYLHRKLMADDPSIHDTIPEIGVCKYEPRDLLAWAASAASSTKFDDRKITDRDTNNVIGTKKTLVFYECRVPARKI